MTTFTPREIKNRKFKQSLMGIDAEEVKSFLKVVAAEFDKILTQNAQLEKRLTEQTVRSTLTTRKELEKITRRRTGRPSRRPAGQYRRGNPLPGEGTGRRDPAEGRAGGR